MKLEFTNFTNTRTIFFTDRNNNVPTAKNLEQPYRRPLISMKIWPIQGYYTQTSMQEARSCNVSVGDAFVDP